MTRSCCCGAIVMSCAARWPMPAPGSPASRPSSPTAPRTDACTGAADPRRLLRRRRGGPRARRARRAAAPRWRSSTSTASARSTPAAARRPATRPCGPSPSACAASRARPTSSGAPAPTSSPSSCPARACAARAPAASGSSPSSRQRHPARGLHHRLGRRRHRIAPAPRSSACWPPPPAAWIAPAPTAARAPRRARPSGGVEPLPRPGARHRGAGHRAGRARPLHRRALRLRRRAWPGPSPPRLGLDEVEVERIGHAALLHDIGKVGDARPRPAQARPADAARSGTLMREHPVIGERILRAIPGMGAWRGSSATSTSASTARGYPDGLAGEEIPLGSRIILACDAYHAMTSDRPYRARDGARRRGRRAGALRRLAVRPAHRRGARGLPRPRRRPRRASAQPPR